jgi:hypothetical protein
MDNTKKHEELKVTQYKWGGRLGPFRIKTNCDQCDLTTAVLNDMAENEFKGVALKLEVKPWLDNFFYCLLRGAWHAPIIIVNGKKFYQFTEKEPLFDREKLAEFINKEKKELNGA